MPSTEFILRLEPRLLLAGGVVRALEPDTLRLPNPLRASGVSPIQVDLSYTPAETLVPARRVTGDGGVCIERSTDGVNFAAVATLPADGGAYSDRGLLSDTAYTYRVRREGSPAVLATALARTQKYDAGLIGTFASPSAVTGTTRSILSFGATSNNSSNDDATAIRNAIAASSAGDEVYIPNGVYHLKSRDIKLKTGVSIRGQSMSGTILVAQFSDQGADNPNSQVFRVEEGRNNITFSNFRIEMDGGQSMLYGIALGSGSTGVANARRVAIRNVNIEGFERFAIAIRNCDNILVENCLLRNATALGGGGQGYGVMIGYPQTFNVWVKGNTIGPVIRHAVIIQYVAHHNLVEHNIAIDNTEDAYDLHGEDEYSNELRYNIAYGGGGYGFGIGNTGSTHDDSGPDNWIHHNEVYNSRGGVNIILGSDRQFIEDNYFHHNTEAGIKVNNGGGRDLWFLRNRIQFNPVGVRLEDAIDPVLIDNVITHNTGSSLIIAASTTGYLVWRNDLRSNGAAAQIFSSEGIFDENLV